MEWIEANPLPEMCQSCSEGDCYNCDYAGSRWCLSREDTLRLRQKALQKAIDRLQEQLKIVEKDLLACSGKNALDFPADLIGKG